MARVETACLDGAYRKGINKRGNINTPQMVLRKAKMKAKCEKSLQELKGLRSYKKMAAGKA